MEILNQLTDTSKIKEQAQNVALRIVSDRRTIYVATGIILSYLIIRLLVGRRTTKVIKTKGTAGGNITLTNKKPSLLVQIVQMAIQTLILHYVRKVLKEMLEPVKQTSKANSSTQT